MENNIGKVREFCQSGKVGTMPGNWFYINKSWCLYWRLCYGLFPPTERETETDSKPDRYIVLCRTFSTELDPDMDPCTETFPDGYCAHFRDGSPSQ